MVGTVQLVVLVVLVVRVVKLDSSGRTVACCRVSGLLNVTFVYVFCSRIPGICFINSVELLMCLMPFCF